MRGFVLLLTTVTLIVTGAIGASLGVTPRAIEGTVAAGIDLPERGPQRAAPAARAAASIPFPYVPEVEWLGTTVNYDEGRGDAPIQYIVIHYTEITYERTLRAFTDPDSEVSAHYVVRADGHVVQPVGEADTAWHAGNYWFNQRSIGIELERSDESNPDFTAAQYLAAAALSCGAAGRYGIPIDRAHIVGHNEIPESDHTDPGPTWDWPHFMWLVSLCAPPTDATVRAAFVTQTPSPVVAAGDVAGVSVVLRNTGATAWRKGTPQEARLAIRGNDRTLAYLAEGWLAPDRPAVQNEEIVPPGGEATFTFAVKGLLPGRFVLPLRGVVDGGGWMDDMGLYAEFTIR